MPKFLVLAVLEVLMLNLFNKCKIHMNDTMFWVLIAQVFSVKKKNQMTLHALLHIQLSQILKDI